MNNRPNTVLVVCVTVVVVAFMAATVLLIQAVDESQLPEGWLALFLASIPPTLASLVGLARSEQTHRQVNDLANGGMDAKVRAGVADVVDDRYLDPQAAPLIEEARAKRATLDPHGQP